MGELISMADELRDSGRIDDIIGCLERAVQGGEDEELEDGDLISVEMGIADARSLLELMRKLDQGS